MAEHYLTPADIPQPIAQKVLSILNDVADAAALVKRLNITGESDFGIGICTRIINARNQQNGFSSLSQVDAIPFIGPERFTDIVKILSAYNFPEEKKECSDCEFVKSELQRLRYLITDSKMYNDDRILTTIKAQPEHPYVGQTVILTISVTNAATGLPVPNIPVSIVSSWGKIESDEDYVLDRFNPQCRRTNTIGIIKCRLLPDIGESTKESQFSALSAALSRFNNSSADPLSETSQFIELVQQYCWELNSDLRSSIDIIVESQRNTNKDLLTTRHSFSQWQYISSVVTAFTHQINAENTTIQGIAAFPLLLKNWIPQFITTFKDLISKSIAEKVGYRPILDKKLSTDATQMLIYNTTNAYLNENTGITRTLIAQQALALELDTLLNNKELSSLVPISVRNTLMDLRIFAGMENPSIQEVVLHQNSKLQIMQTENKTIRMIDQRYTSMKQEVTDSIQSSVSSQTPELISGMVSAAITEKFPSFINAEISARIGPALSSAIETILPDKIDAIFESRIQSSLKSAFDAQLSEQIESAVSLELQKQVPIRITEELNRRGR